MYGSAFDDTLVRQLYVQEISGTTLKDLAEKFFFRKKISVFINQLNLLRVSPTVERES